MPPVPVLFVESLLHAPPRAANTSVPESNPIVTALLNVFIMRSVVTRAAFQTSVASVKLGMVFRRATEATDGQRRVTRAAQEFARTAEEGIKFSRRRNSSETFGVAS